MPSNPFGLKQPTPTGLTAIADNTLFNRFLKKLEQTFTDVTFDVTYLKQILGDQDTITGYYKEGFAIYTIRMAVLNPQTAWSMTGAGYHTNCDMVGFTNHMVTVGSVIQTEAGTFYEIVTMGPHEMGGQTAYYVCDLVQKPNFRIAGDFFGFTTYDYDPKYRPLSSEFEDGFQRGFWRR